MAASPTNANDSFWQRLTRSAKGIEWQPSTSVLALAERELRRNLPWVVLLAAMGSIIADGSFYLAQQNTRLTIPLIFSHAVVSLLCLYWIKFPTKNINTFFIGAYLYLALTIAIPSILFQRPSDLVQLGVLSMATFYIMLDFRYLLIAQAIGLAILGYALAQLQSKVEMDDTVWVIISIGIAGLMLHIGRRNSVADLAETTKALLAEAGFRQHAEEQSLVGKKREELAATVSGVAHDFNNLLLGISGGLELARLDTKMEHSSLQALELASDSSEAAKELCANLLEHTKGTELSHTFVGVTELVASAVRHVELISTLHHHIDIETSNSDEQLVGHHGQLRQVFINLLDNAMHAATSKVRIKTSTNFVDNKRLVTIIVEDDGSGVERNIRKQIFNPFFSTKEEGKGLGLATVAATVTAHGGEVHVEESSLGGARFIVTIPSAHDSSSTTEPHLEQELEPLRSLDNIIANVFDDLPYLVFQKDINNRHLRVNSTVGKLRGIPVEKFENTSVQDMHPDEALNYYKDDQEVIATATPKLNIKEQIEVAPGKKYWFLTDKYPTFCDNKKVNGVLAICKLADPEDEKALRKAMDSETA